VTVLQKESSTKETNDQWVIRVGYALRNLDDRSVLNRSPLARLTYVDRLVRERYSNHILPRGLALREVLVECVGRVVNELSKEPGLSRACRYLNLLKQGLSCRQISSELGLSREHVSRVYRLKALELVTTEFLSTVKSTSYGSSRLKLSN
jgi:hypothetical protein